MRVHKYLPFLLVIAAVFAAPSSPAGDGGRKITVVASLFPLYDFAKAVGGDRVEASLLLPPGAESHAYEPTPADVAAIAKADLFLHMGPDLEPWAARLAEAARAGRAETDASRSASAELAKGTAGDARRLDPHLWLDPILAMAMLDDVAAGLCAADPADATVYRTNAAAFKGELQKLDADFRALAAAGSKKTLVFGGRFAFIHLTERYGFRHVGVYDNCGPEAEPSVRAVVTVVEFVKANHVRVIYHEEMAEPRVAKIIAGETGAKLLMAHSLHNLSADEWAAGATYLGIMRNNLAAFAEGLR